MFLRLPCMGGTGTLTKQLLKLDEPFNNTQEFWDFMDTECGTAPSESGGTRNAAQGQAESHTVGVWCSLPMLGPCAQRQRYATACSAYRPTFIRCLSKVRDNKGNE